MVNSETLTDIQKKIFQAIPNGDIGELKTLLTRLEGTTDFVDENGMTPLQVCLKFKFNNPCDSYWFLNLCE